MNNKKKLFSTIFLWTSMFPAYMTFVINYEEQIQNDFHETAYFMDNCNTIECQTSIFIMKHLNQSVNPCDDFYEFACGGWIKDNPVPTTQSHINQFQLAEERLQTQLREILEKHDENDPMPVKAASLYYRSCMDSRRIENEGMSQLVKFLTEYGGWPITLQNWDKSKFNWLKLCTGSMKRLGVASLMNIFVGLDKRNSNRSVVLVDQTALLLPRSMLVEPKMYSVQLEAYRQWISACAMLISKHLNENVTIDAIETKAQSIIEFEIELAKLTSSNEMRRNAFRMYNNWTLRSLQEWTDSANSDFKIDWLTIIRDIFSETGISINYEERVIVKEVDFLFNLAILLQSTPTETLVRITKAENATHDNFRCTICPTDVPIFEQVVTKRGLIT